MDTVPDPNNYLRELNGFLYKELTELLDTNEIWKKVAAEFHIFDWRDVSTMGKKHSPATALLGVLVARNCTVKHLRKVLEKCNLVEPLALLSEPEPLRIVGQPGDDDSDEFVPYGHTLRLEVVAIGNPPPRYLWCHENSELEDQRNSILVIDNFTPDYSGEYRCLVSQDDGTEEFSRPVYVQMLPEPPVIQVQPLPASIQMGQEVILTCEAAGYPPPLYEWMHGNMLLLGENESTLKIEHASPSHDGMYKCRVSNECGEIDSDKVRIAVFVHQTEQEVERKRPQLIVEEKVALLIANDEYENLDALKTPCNDVKTLSTLLTRLGFKVLALCNLTLSEMTNAVNTLCKMIPEGAYVFFYFVGHGFKLHEKYMLPVDCPEPKMYRRAGSLSECYVLQKVLERKPLLLVSLLDMCLKIPKREENPGIFSEQVDPISYNPNRNLIQGYATTCNLGAYENPLENNGIYVKHLQKFLAEPRPFVRILEDVIESISQEPSDAVTLQMPSHGHNVVCDMHDLTVPSREHPETRKLFESYTSLPNNSIICFKHMQVPVKFHLYKDCFHNAIEMHIPRLDKYRIFIQSQSTDLEMRLRVNEEAGESFIVVSVLHLQKLKFSGISLSVSMFDRVSDHLVDNALLDLSSLPIVSAELWFESPFSS